jgi:hypothetical protein
MDRRLWIFSSPLIDHLLKMPQGQPLPCHSVNENVSLLPVPHTAASCWYCRSASWSWAHRDVAPGPAVVFALGFREGDLAGIAVPQLDPGLQDFPGSHSQYCLCALRVLCGLLLKSHGPFSCSLSFNVPQG